MADVVIAPDKFKGSLNATAVARHLAAGLRAVRPDLDVATVPVADGGEGFLEAALRAGYRRVRVPATGPTGEPLISSYAQRGATAVIELADTAGLARLPGRRPAPLTASSAGTGEVIRAALDAGCRTVVLGLGGSACTDGGAGLLEALGAKVIGARGPGGAGLAAATELRLDGLHPAAAATTFVLAGDVDNPLLGPDGAAARYGPQKGATPAEVRHLEAVMTRWAHLVGLATDRDLAFAPGAGTAGGVGIAVMAVLGASARPGIELVLDLVDLATRVAGAHLVITGEGSLDEQTVHGKAPAGVAALARAAGIPVVAVAGRIKLQAARLHALGFDSAVALTDLEPNTRRCMTNAGGLLRRIGALLARHPALNPATPAPTGPRPAPRHRTAHGAANTSSTNERVSMSSTGIVVAELAPTPKASYSQAFWANGLLFTAGLGPHDPATGQPRGDTVEEQTEATLRNIEAVLGAAGLTLSDIVKATVHLQDLRRDFAGFEAVYHKILGEPYPARITVGSDLPGILVEIEVVAHRSPEQ